MYVVFGILFIYVVLFARFYYKRHYQYRINDRFAIVDFYNDGDGFYLIRNVGKKKQTLVIPPPIVWYCHTKQFILGCRGEDISQKDEDYKPVCQHNLYFIVNTQDERITQNLSKEDLTNFMIMNKLQCKKTFIYTK